MNNQSAIIIGKVVATHGINGWVVIHSYSHPSDNIKNYNTFLLIEDEVRTIKILQLKVMPKKIIVQLEDYMDISTSQKIIGQNIYVNASEIPSLNKGEYYWKDIEGLNVYTTHDLLIGSVDFIFNNGANDVLAIKKEGKYVYIPYVSEYVKVIVNEKIVINHEVI